MFNREKQVKKCMYILLIFSPLFFLFHTNVNAYIDPGSVNYVLQILIAGFIGAAFIIKVFWKNIKQFVARIIKKKNEKE